VGAADGGGCCFLFGSFFARETVCSCIGVRMGGTGSGEESPKTLATRGGEKRAVDVLTLGFDEKRPLSGASPGPGQEN
jgi:hypothetical protein